MTPGRAAVALGLTVASALAPSLAAAQRYFVHTYSETDGLPSSTTNDIAQGADGSMWFATRSGIARYDGVDWTPFSTADGLDSPDQFGLAVDGAGTLWAACAADPFTVAAYRDGRWHALAASPPPARVGERTTGFAVTRAGGRTLAVLATSEKRIHVWDGAGWKRLDPGLALGPATVVAGCGGRFFASTERGLASFGGGAPEPVVEVFEGMPSPRVLGLAVEEAVEGGSCRLWLAGPDWLGRVEGSAFTLVAEGIPNPLGTGYEYLVLEPDREGGAFVGNPFGLRHVSARGEMEELTTRSGLIATGATSVEVDRERNVWIASLRGVSKVASFRFGTWDQRHGLLENEVTAVLERRNGSFVFGHGQGLSLLEEGGVRTLVFDTADVPASTIRVLDLAEDASGRVWVAASGLGLARVDAGGDLRWHLREDSPEAIHSVLVDRAETVWALSADAVYRVTSRRFERVAGGPTRENRRLFEGADGTLYVATGGDGLHERRGGRWVRWDVGPNEANDVFAVLDGPGEELWIGTAAGLFVRRAGGRVERAALGGAPIGRRVYLLVRDDRGRLWIGTDNGVLRWDPERRERRHFTVLDGLAGRETNRAAGILDSRGRVWIGTEQGVSVYDGSRERRHPVVPRPAFRFLEAGGQRYSLDRPVQLGQGRGDLLFGFRATSFFDEQRLSYRSRLEGYEEGWSPPFASPTIRYTNLSPGKYRFHLQASTAGGPWSAAISSAAIVIPRPFWASPLFYALLAATAAWGLYQLQGYAAQKRYSRRLEDDVRERTAELSQANADLRAEAVERERAETERERLIRELEARNAELESFTYTVSHDLKSPLVTIEGFLGWLERHVTRGDTTRAASDVEQIRSAARRMGTLLDELLRLSRVGRVANEPEQVSLQEMVREAVRMVAGEIAERGARVEVAPDLPPVFADRVRLLQVLQNLLKNAVRFSGDQPRPRIEISAREDASEVVCCVRDDGIGIEPEYQERVFRLFERLDPERGGTGVGLAIAQRILAAHGGRIWIESEGAGRGTAVCFSLPRPAAARGD